MTDPRFLTLFSSVFILLGAYNIYTGLKRWREARLQNRPIAWYKQLSLLTGIEYVLLALVFLLSTANRENNLSPTVRSIIVPLYLVMLIAAAILAGLVIRQSLKNARTMRAQGAGRAASTQATTQSKQTSEVESPEERALYTQRRRERRNNAAAARRRKAGKA